MCVCCVLCIHVSVCILTTGAHPLQGSWGGGGGGGGAPYASEGAQGSLRVYFVHHYEYRNYISSQNGILGDASANPTVTPVCV